MNNYAPALSHFGVFVSDLDMMSQFYCDVFDMVVTDRGEGQTMPFTIAFLSGNPLQHHQLALASGRDLDHPSTVMQISFKIKDIEQLRQAQERALGEGASDMRGLNHGNALSIYFKDPEGNTVEVYLDTPWYVAQPHGDPLDLNLSDEEIWAETERIVKSDPTFKTVEQWQTEFARA
jgi:catechol-2,3-dioxygenase